MLTLKNNKKGVTFEEKVTDLIDVINSKNIKIWRKFFANNNNVHKCILVGEPNEDKNGNKEKSELKICRKFGLYIFGIYYIY